MDSKHSCLSVVVSFLTFLQNVVESIGEAYACDSPYIDNGRPVNVPAETYRTYCCKAKKYSYGTSTSRFSCATEGGCCGETDSQYCCDIDKIGVQLGLGLTAGALVLLGIIALILYCFVRSYYSSMGQEVYCAECCKCKVRDKERPATFNYFSAIRHAREDVESTSDDFTSHGTSRPRQPYPAPETFRAEPRAPRTPTAPRPATSPPPPIQDPIDAPPSYDDVVNNPSVFPKTNQSDGQMYV